MLFFMRKEKSKLVMLGVVLFLFSNLFSSVHAQSIPITKSEAMRDVNFDGKWSFFYEWKPTSLTEVTTESGTVYIRTAHYENYIYILIDVVADKTINNNEDYALVCFDSKYDKSTLPDTNDYCFSTNLTSVTLLNIFREKPITLRGSVDGTLEIIENHKDLIALGTVSDDNDRYTPIPHISYEFRIPLDVLGRSDMYGFFLSVFDSDTSTTYTWPPKLQLAADSKVPSPQEWGILYSPDKSLPEYELPLFVLAFEILPIILATSKYRKNLFSLYK